MLFYKWFNKLTIVIALMLKINRAKAFSIYTKWFTL
jgi:hypothetical protein